MPARSPNFGRTTPADRPADPRAERRRTCVDAVASGRLSVAAACADYRISLRTFYRWQRLRGVRRAAPRHCFSLADRLACLRDVTSGRVSVRHACRQRNISVRTFYRWMSQRDNIESLVDPHPGPAPDAPHPARGPVDASPAQQPVQQQAPRQPPSLQSPPPRPEAVIGEPMLVEEPPHVPHGASATAPTDASLAESDFTPSQSATPVLSDAQPPTPRPELPQASCQEPVSPSADRAMLTKLRPVKSVSPASADDRGLDEQPLSQQSEEMQPQRSLQSTRTRPELVQSSHSANGQEPQELSSSDSTPAQPQPTTEGDSPSENSPTKNTSHELPYGSATAHKRRIIVVGNGKEVAIAWYPGATARDISQTIAKRLALPENQLVLLEHESEPETLLVSPFMPNGTYRLVDS